MKIEALRNPNMAFVGPIAGGGLLIAAAVLLMPSHWQIADAIRRATFAPPPVAMPLPPPGTAILMQRFAQGKSLSPPDLQRLLNASVATADAKVLGRLADALARGGAPVSSARLTYDIMAGGRPEVALAFLEGRPDRAAPAHWRLRFDLHRKVGDAQGAADLARAAVMNPGTAPAKDLVEASYALGQPDLLILAAEHGAMAPLDPARSLDLASWANAAGRYDLIARIDRFGTPRWRERNPWLAMTLAQRSGDIRSALRYAAMLPTGRDAARESIVMASGNGDAVRRWLLDRAAEPGADRPAIAQRLLERGFRSDSIALLRQQSAASNDAVSDARMLYLMGPRPVAQDLAWLKERASADPTWVQPYVERAGPAEALAFLEAAGSADSNDILVQRIALANAARDRAAAARALDRLLDGRPLSAAQLKAAAAARVPPERAAYYDLALANARIANGAAEPLDRLRLAWDGWNRGDAREAAGQLQVYLRERPDDREALSLMADAQAKLKGEAGARPWIERSLALAPPLSVERAELLARLGRTAEATAIVEALRRAAPADRKLDIMLARLLIAAGDPGRARKVLRP
ncbi:hypothetical protein M527_05960 [Sphingobium indicum IP26]|uniref:Tetratricopeptide repeat protein n=1 Tax=Sphingobium indicum F2 TaxID=1450518 RepID=A0A8E0WRS5_9SPHN|nr:MULTISPECIES: hypothetical protein [Sphingobium]EPR09670.1 hypothetical protein M527_05960 [Sphingobium indicum IP26]EQB04859.1 hypothetical protein L286_08800 [Sphingobium sp. HDIP04]KER36250.1 hypothetical protein AL00_12080 [Sphingobium indicum F2]KER38300.1 hypothetical protein AL00_00845 [Sphingobium indicum F2]